MKNEPEKHAQQHLQHLSEHESKVQAKSIHKKKTGKKACKSHAKFIQRGTDTKTFTCCFLTSSKARPLSD